MALVQKNFSDIITFSRASAAWHYNSAGVLVQAAAGEPRFDYDPVTKVMRGLLIEEQRTNAVRNNTMQGAVVGAPGTLPTNWSVNGLGTLAVSVVQVGTESGIPYIDLRFSGTSSTTGLNVVVEAQAAVAQNQPWNTSAFLKSVAGGEGVAFRFSHAEWDSGNVLVASGTSAALAVGSATDNLAAVRREYTRVVANAGAVRLQAIIGAGFTSGVPVDFTIRIGAPQAEQGSFASFPILTTTAQATRAADVATINTLSPWFTPYEGTFVVEYSPVGIIASAGLVSLDDGTINNRVGIFLTGGGAPSTVTARITTAGVAADPAVTGSVAVGAKSKVAIAYGVGADKGALCVNGGAPTLSSPAATPTVNVLRIGRIFGGTTYANGHISNIRYIPRRVSNAELQALTT